MNINNNYGLNLQENNRIINYIITDNSDEVKNNDGLGNIIIYTSDNGEGAVNNDAIKTSYNNLYIGDEHIATGFGFKNTTDRDYTYSYIGYILNYADIINNNLSVSYSYTLELAKQLNNINELNLSIDENKNSFIINDTKYKLEKTKDNTLYINKQIEFIVNDVKVYYDIYVENNNQLVLESTNNYISLTNNKIIPLNNNFNLQITGIFISFSHNVEIKQWSLSYKLYNSETGKNITNNPIYVVENTENMSDSPYKIGFVDNEKIYTISENGFDTKYGEVYNGQYKINLENYYNITRELISLNNTGVEDADVKMVLNMYDKNNSVIKITLPALRFVSPIYYFTIDNINNISANVLSNINSCIYTNYYENEDIDIIYENVGNENKYYCVCLPVIICNKYNISFTLKRQIDINIQWNKSLINNNIIENYCLFYTPYKYSGDMHWIIKLK